ncbi:hypothetical protein BKA62DRAFT_687999 [Auriculariales sp. MPI-PUGE-AT-0066]|nr:hypothetical protein BKA62DRAFT_687999 [Auriculariales sp. MPI-PUGE-AT-0066]
MATDAALLREIEQLTAAIKNRKGQPAPAYFVPTRHQATSHYASVKSTYAPPTRPYEVVLNGSTYVSSNRKLTLKPASSATPPVSASSSGALVEATAAGTSSNVSASSIANPAVPVTSRLSSNYSSATHHHHRTAGGHRLHKATPHFTGKLVRPARPSRNRVLNNVTGTTTSTGRAARKVRPRKQCRFFTMTGVCKRAKTCPYEHDPNKVAICPRYLQGDCPHSASQCPLSHESTAERVPICVHFANNGRCNKGSQCMYPHINVGKREGVCRDFAVLGYCEKGADCDKQHIRECPDFAEKGSCDKKGCKLPHVIRANRTRKVDPTTGATTTLDSNNTIPAYSRKGKLRPGISAVSAGAGAFVDAEPSRAVVSTSGEEEFIPLTFHESSDDDEVESEDDDDENEEDSDDGTEPEEVAMQG